MMGYNEANHSNQESPGVIGQKQSNYFKKILKTGIAALTVGLSACDSTGPSSFELSDKGYNKDYLTVQSTLQNGSTRNSFASALATGRGFQNDLSWNSVAENEQRLNLYFDGQTGASSTPGLGNGEEAFFGINFYAPENLVVFRFGTDRGTRTYDVGVQVDPATWSTIMAIFPNNDYNTSEPFSVSASEFKDFIKDGGRPLDTFVSAMQSGVSQPDSIEQINWADSASVRNLLNTLTDGNYENWETAGMQINPDRTGNNYANLLATKVAGAPAEYAYIAKVTTPSIQTLEELLKNRGGL